MYLRFTMWWFHICGMVATIKLIHTSIVSYCWAPTLWLLKNQEILPFSLSAQYQIGSHMGVTAHKAGSVWQREEVEQGPLSHMGNGIRGLHFQKEVRLRGDLIWRKGKVGPCRLEAWERLLFTSHLLVESKRKKKIFK